MYGQDRALGLAWCVGTALLPGILVGYVMHYIGISQALSIAVGAVIALSGAITVHIVLMRIMRKWDEDMGR